MSLDIQNLFIQGTKVVKIPGDPEGKHIMLLHGYGANAENLSILSAVYRKRPRPTWYFPEGPLTIDLTADYQGHAWFPVDMDLLQSAYKQGLLNLVEKAFPKELEHACSDIQKIIDELKIPLDQLILGGFSQGAILTLETLFHLNQKILGVILLSGTLINEVKWQEKASLMAETPFFQSHGSNDPILPFDSAKKLYTLLTEAQWKGTFFEFEGGHDLTQSLLIALHKFLASILE